ncbi:MAG: GNAT family N-acetyltransferase [Anaerolineae bacterium]|jgi:ribosomal protein S18 acetylase RimI-like enzyme|nr:GNAT family N-acetyltransferase [Anaerolineae bacterium]MDH7473689.1 GNAT family N-acetyltransferase [Anaerolineae bacterium]
MIHAWEVFKRLSYDWKEKIQREGWRGASRWLIEVLALLPYRHIEYIVFVRSLREPLPVVTPRLPVTLRPATEADLTRFQGLVPPSEIRYFSQRLAHARHCFLALDGEQLAAYCWATTQVESHVDNLELKLQPGDVYVDDAFTVPAYRRQGIQTAVHLYRLQYMKDRGCQRAILIVSEDNVASQQLVRKLGYQEIDRLSFRRILWKRIYHYHSGKL